MHAYFFLSGIFDAAYAGEDAWNPPDYTVAIRQAEILGRTDRRASLSRCVKLWDDVREERQHLIDEVRKNGLDKAPRSVLLEIGASGFARYDYVRVDGSQLRTSYPSATRGISNTRLAERIANLYSAPAVTLTGRADGPVDDGSCYFLTVEKDGTRATAAIYATPNDTPAGLLLKELLDTVRQKTSD